MDMFSHELETLIEKKIREAEEKGMFNNLPTHGKKLNLQENPFAEKDWQLAFKVLKDNGVAPEFVERRKEIEEIQAEMKELRKGAIRGQKHLYRELLGKLETAIKALNSSLVRENHFIQGSFQLPQVDINVEMAEFEKELS